MSIPSTRLGNKRPLGLLKGESLILANGDSNRPRQRVRVRRDLVPLRWGLNNINEAKGDGIDDVLNLTEDSRNRSTDEGHGLEEPGLADQDVEEHLVHPNKGAEGIGDGHGVGLSGQRVRVCLHGCDGRAGRGDDVGEAGNDWL